MTLQKLAAPWLERARGEAGPIYLAVVRALETAVREGELQPGERLPAQRAVAAQLGVDLTTVTRAYGLAADLGLLTSEVGRGAFVARPRQDDEAGLADLSMNLPPPPEGLSLGALLQETIDAILARTDAATLMGYHPGFGTVGQKLAGAEWLAPVLGERPPACVLVSPGAQAAMFAVFSSLCQPGDVIVAEPLTYPGSLALARQLGLRVVACPGDADGPDPDALATLCRREHAKAVYLTPTMQNPTARTIPTRRREALAGVIEGAGVWLVEDDPYSRLLDAPPPAIASFAPTRGIYVATLAKTLSPGLRIAYLACPEPALTERLAAGLRAVALTPAPLMAAVATAWIREGRAETLLAAVRSEARARRAIAAQILPAGQGAPESLHVWLPLPSSASADRLRLAGQQRGLALVTHEAFAVDAATASPGLRVSLGGPARRAGLTSALRSLAELLGAPSPDSRMIV